MILEKANHHAEEIAAQGGVSLLEDDVVQNELRVCEREKREQIQQGCHAQMRHVAVSDIRLVLELDEDKLVYVQVDDVLQIWADEWQQRA